MRELRLRRSQTNFESLDDGARRGLVPPLADAFRVEVAPMSTRRTEVYRSRMMRRRALLRAPAPTRGDPAAGFRYDTRDVYLRGMYRRHVERPW